MGSINKASTLIDPGPTNLLEVLDGLDSDSETISDVDGVLRDEDIDLDFDLSGAFGLAEDDNPFIELEDALFAEMCGETELSGAQLLIQHIPCLLTSILCYR
jgi:hypothetical protein